MNTQETASPLLIPDGAELTRWGLMLKALTGQLQTAPEPAQPGPFLTHWSVLHEAD